MVAGGGWWWLVPGYQLRAERVYRLPSSDQQPDGGSSLLTGAGALTSPHQSSPPPQPSNPAAGGAGGRVLSSIETTRSLITGHCTLDRHQTLRQINWESLAPLYYD